MINKKQFGNNANRKRINGVENKRYSKAKFKQENGNMSLSEKKEENVKPEVEAKKFNTADYYYQKYENEATRNHKWAGGKVEQVTCMILTEPSINANGYKVLPKGQCVTVTKFVDNPYRKVKATDGRIGIIPAERGAKPMLFKNA